ncbi:MAG: hypothetical protein PHS09_00205 [Candidatus Omnitrophica bacterium]|nr:hypothetical protein [Candidatus Omnitrophota bacterium]
MKINNSGKNSVLIILLIAVCALLLRFGIEQLIVSNMATNDSNAAVVLKSISAALENYSKDHQGSFPGSLSALTQTSPPYLDQSYLNKAPIRGYAFSCPRLDPAGYTCSATPTRCKISGSMNYTITTGGVMVSENCRNNDYPDKAR